MKACHEQEKEAYPNGERLYREEAARNRFSVRRGVLCARRPASIAGKGRLLRKTASPNLGAALRVVRDCPRLSFRAERSEAKNF